MLSITNWIRDKRDTQSKLAIGACIRTYLFVCMHEHTMHEDKRNVGDPNRSDLQPSVMNNPIFNTPIQTTIIKSIYSNTIWSFFFVLFLEAGHSHAHATEISVETYILLNIV